MRDSVRLGSINGIPIGLHWTVALVAAFFTLTLAGTLLPALAPGYSSLAYTVTAAVTATVFFASIIAHELGHSLVAQRNRVGVSGITLFALGGVAKLDSEPDNAGAAARIALAGPAVSVAIGIGSLIGAGVLATLGLPTLVTSGVLWLGIINLGMAVFNMLPAFPLDGGRVLQAWMWHRKGDRERATISAATVGRYLGWAMIAFGLWSLLTGGGGLWTALIGWFIVAGAGAEARRARFEIQRRQWAPPAWPGVFFTGHRPAPGSNGPTSAGPTGFGPTGFGPQGPPPPRADERFDPRRPSTWPGPADQGQDGVIEVSGRPVR